MVRGGQRHWPCLGDTGWGGVPPRNQWGRGLLEIQEGEKKMWPDRTRLGIKGHLLPSIAQRSHLSGRDYGLNGQKGARGNKGRRRC